ncbi:MAG TPA: hypothetical protein VGQ99_12255 [Tepidisphaeraceae bacterium]|jgi:hypothetical protein|nr:hypothetical protein [Tepidisphaeraceae bacterium]
MPERTVASVPAKPTENAKLVKPDFESFLAALSARDRLNIERHLATCDAEPTADHAKVFKKLATTLAGLAPQAVRTTGQRAIQFFNADGKYRVQVFALEDLCDGNVTVYLTDALDAAITAGIFRRRAKTDGEASLYELAEQAGTFLRIERLTSANTVEAPDYFRHMLGWNRKALKLTLPTNSTAAQLRAAESLFVLAARKTSA